MRLDASLPGLRLLDDQVARLRRASGTRLQSLGGCLWVTQNGSLDDRVLGPGEHWTVPDDAEVIVSAFRGDATLGLRGPDGRAPCASMTLVNGDDGGRVGRWLSRVGGPLGELL